MKQKWNLIIKNGTIVGEAGAFEGDLAIAGDKIAAIGSSLPDDGAFVIDAAGKLVLPGMIDSHVHIQTGTGESRSKDNYRNGSIAAAYGGTTSFIDFAFNNEGEHPADSMERKMKEASGSSLLDYSFHPCINRLDQESLEAVRWYMRNGFPSVKLFTVYRDTLMLEKKGIYEILKMAGEENALALVHAEDADIIERNILDAVNAGKTGPADHAACRPVISEVEAMFGVLALALETKAAVLFVHMTTGKSRELLQRKGDARIYTEVCPHYLALDQSVYEQENGFNYICSPPIRPAEDRWELWELIEEGYVQVVNSDHTDYATEQKEKYKAYFPKVPNGLPTLETRGAVFFSEAVAKRKMPLEQFAALTSTNAAKLMGIYPQKGVLRPGSDADIVVFDPRKEYIMRASDMHMQTDFCPYEGMRAVGKVVHTIVGGEILIAEGVYTGNHRTGRLMKRHRPDFL